MVRTNVWLEGQNLAARRELTMRERKERDMEGSLCSTSGARMALMAAPWNPSGQHATLHRGWRHCSRILASLLLPRPTRNGGDLEEDPRRPPRAINKAGRDGRGDLTPLECRWPHVAGLPCASRRPPLRQPPLAPAPAAGHPCQLPSTPALLRLRPVVSHCSNRVLRSVG
jgi:hypothetical protein